MLHCLHIIVGGIVPVIIIKSTASLTLASARNNFCLFTLIVVI